MESPKSNHNISHNKNSEIIHSWRRKNQQTTNADNKSVITNYLSLKQRNSYANL